jgi:hypothetical protein
MNNVASRDSGQKDLAMNDWVCSKGLENHQAKPDIATKPKHGNYEMGGIQPSKHWDITDYND